VLTPKQLRVVLYLFLYPGKSGTDSQRFDFRPPERWWEEWFQVSRQAGRQGDRARFARQS
jgi:hypothetical protein